MGENEPHAEPLGECCADVERGDRLAGSVDTADDRSRHRSLVTSSA
jgi:hypothetical protein